MKHFSVNVSCLDDVCFPKRRVGLLLSTICLSKCRVGLLRIMCLSKRRAGLLRMMCLSKRCAVFGCLEGCACQIAVLVCFG